MLSVTPVYAALLSLVYIGLAMRVSKYRRTQLLSLGDHGDTRLQHLIRAHGNASETIPLGLLLLLMAELQGAPGLAVHVLGLTLLAGRLAHARGLSAEPPVLRLRIIGMGLTVVMMAITAVGLLLHAIF